MNQLIGAAIARIHYRSVRRLLAESDPGEADLRRLEPILTRLTKQNPLRGGIVGEIKFRHQMVRQIEGDTLNWYHYSAEPKSDSLIRTASWFVMPLIRRADRMHLESKALLLEKAGTPRFRRQALPSYTPSSWLPRWAASIFVAEGLNENILLRGDHHQALTNIARIALALRLHRIEKGSYPEALDALSPGFLAEIPADNFTGAPFPYRREGEGFVLESAGKESRLEPPGVIEEVPEWRIPK